MSKVLLTGVAGFIGSNIAKFFLDKGYDVIGVDDLSSGNADNIPSGVDFFQLDLSDISNCSKLPKGCQKILHLAGQP